MQPAITASLIFVLLIVNLAALTQLNKRLTIHPEILRKILHVSMGCVCLGLTWVFSRQKEVIVLAIACIILLILIKYIRFLKNQLGSPLNLVNRNTYGEIYFTLGVFSTYLLAEGDHFLFLLPVAILTFSDSSAALSGVFFGKRTYTTPDDTKTVLGSSVFFISSIAISIFVMVLMTDLSIEKIVLVSVILGLVLMLIEAVSWRGMDNLLIPVVCFTILKSHLIYPISTLHTNLLVFVVLSGLLLYWQRHCRFRDEVINMSILYCYACWVYAGSSWMLIAIAVLVIYPYLYSNEEKVSNYPYNSSAAFSLLGTGVLFLLIEQMFKVPHSFYIYTLSFSIHLSLIKLISMRSRFPGYNYFGLSLLSSLKIFTIMFFIYWFIADKADVMLVLISLPVLLLSNGIFLITQKKLNAYHSDAKRWFVQAILTCGISVSLLVLLEFVLPYDWNNYI